MLDLELERLITQGEGSTVECKSTVENAVKIAKTLAAFANTNGGTLLVGVADDGTVCGVASEYDALAVIEAAAEQICEPPVSVSYQTVTAEGKLVLVFSIPESEDKPHAVRDTGGDATVYVRFNDKSMPTSRATARHLEANAAPPDKALLQSPPVKALAKYLKTNEYVTAKRFAKFANLSDRRAARLLIDLAQSHYLIAVARDKDVVYAIAPQPPKGEK